MNFRPLELAAMSSDETPKIDPKIEPTLIINDSPPIAAVDQPPAIDARAEIEAAKGEIKIEPKLEAEKIEKIEPKIETLPPAAQISTPVAEIIPYRRPDPKPEHIAPEQPARARSGRFALLAACVAFAASAGALGGSLGVAKLGPMLAEAKPPVMPVAKDHVADEVKSLQDTVAQLRTTTKSLSDNLAALKTSVNTSNSAQNTQIGKIAETLDRVEKSQAEQRKTASVQPKQEAAPETTGSIAPQKQAAAVPMVLGTPPTTLKPPTVPGYVLRRVYDGAALIEGRDGVIEVEPGIVVPGLGRIEDIKRQDGRWVVVTSRGIIAAAR